MIESREKAVVPLKPRRAGRLCLPCSLLLLALISGLAHPRTFSELGAGRGLDLSMGVTLVFDHQGFLWVGSREGLFRYDGYEAVVFRPDPDDSTSISDGDIRSMHFAADGALWVGTNTAGLNRYDPATGRFARFRHDPSDPQSLSEDAVYGIGEDAEGAIWATTRKGVNRLDPRTGVVERFSHDPTNANSLSHDWGYAVHLGPTGTLWISTVGGGINRWDPASRSFTHLDLAVLTEGAASRNDVFVLHESAGRLWAGTRDGLVVLDLASGSARRLQIGDEAGSGPLITSLYADDQGQLWLGTESAGVLLVDTGTGQWQGAHPGAIGAPGNLPAQPQLSLAGQGGMIFVGTWGAGVYRAPIEEKRFSLVSSGADGRGLSFKNVTAVISGGDTGRPWAGTFGGGPQLVDVVSGRVERPAPGTSDPILTSGVLSFARTGDGVLYAGTTEGLFALSEDGRVLWHEKHDPAGTAGIGPGYVTALMPATGSGIWVGLAAGGLHFRHAESGVYEAHRQDAAQRGSLGSDQVLALAGDSDGSVWVGTGTDGLNRCRVHPWSCERYSGRDGAMPSPGYHHVTDIHRDRSGQLWVSTDGGGLSRVVEDLRGGVQSFEQWDSDRGLLSDSIMAIAEDRDGTLWLSTRRGLTRLDPDTGAVVNHVRQSGLPVSDFNAGAADADDEFLYFGSVDGLLSLPKGSTMASRQVHPVAITGIERLKETPARVERSSTAAKVQVAYGEGLSVRFAVLDYAEVPHEYEYRMGGAESWTPLGTRRELTFVDLAPGSHGLEIRGRDVYGQWSFSKPLEIDVVPPFWMTQWFRAIVVAGLLLALLVAHRARLGVLERRTRELERLKDQREVALRRAEASQRELALAYDDLRNVTRRLESAKEEERLSVSRELHDELGQSLTAAKLGLQMLKRHQPAEREQKRVDETVAILDGMIGQVRNISLSLRPPLLDEAGLVPALEQHLDSLAERSGVNIELDATSSISPETPGVRIVLFRVVQEAVSNALRHAGARNIVVRLAAEADGIRLQVHDDGIGFDSEAVHKRARRGQHLGIVGMAERVHGVGGRFSVQADEGAGSHIDAWVPLQSPHDEDHA